MEKIKLLNAWTGRKEPLPPADPVRLYLAWPYPGPPPALSAAPPPLTAFPDPTAMRAYFTADLFSRLTQRSGRRVQLVDRSEAAQVTVAADTPSSRTGLWLKVAAPARSGGYDGFSLDEIRLYFYSNAPYAAPLKISPDSLAGARAAFGRLKDYVRRFQAAEMEQALPNSAKDSAHVAEWRETFYNLLCDDLTTPRAVATLWMLLQSELSDASKLALLTDFTGALGLNRGLGLPETAARPLRPHVEEKAGQPRPEQRRPAPPEPKRPQVEPRRNQPVVTGFEGRARLQPGSPKTGQKSGKPGEKAGRENGPDEQGIRRIMRSQDVRSYLREPDRFDFTISLVAYDNLPEVRLTVESILKILSRSARSLEVIVVDMNGSDKVFEYLAPLTKGYANFRVVYAQQNLGEAAGRNIAFRQGRGRYLLLLDAGLRLTGDYFEELWRELSREDGQPPALFGAFPVKLLRKGQNLTGFEVLEPGSRPKDGEVEALEGSLLCFRRALVEEAGFMDEHFRFPYALGLDYSFSFKDKGFALKVSPVLEKMVERPVTFARPVYGLPPDQQERQRQRNWQLFLRSWQLEDEAR